MIGARKEPWYETDLPITKLQSVPTLSVSRSRALSARHSLLPRLPG